jgi:hypothetical protein
MREKLKITKFKKFEKFKNSNIKCWQLFNIENFPKNFKISKIKVPKKFNLLILKSTNSA